MRLNDGMKATHFVKPRDFKMEILMFNSSTVIEASTYEEEKTVPIWDDIKIQCMSYSYEFIYSFTLSYITVFATIVRLQGTLAFTMQRCI